MNAMHKIKKLFAFCLFSILALSAMAQGFEVQGRVVDAENVSEGLPSATVRLFVNDTTVVAGTATDLKGYFNIKVKREGLYLLELSFVGCATVTKKVKLTQEEPILKLGDILLSRDVLLDELSVTGLAQELTIKADTFIYHANAFRVPEGSTIAALMKQLPGLSMDSNGNLTFQGKSVSSILVNGKPFIGDANTAMSNIVSDAVEDIAVYEKTDEEKEFAGVLDLEKATVVDLKIKKEYMSQWSVNADAGVGTNSKYIAKAFASNFTDKRRTAIYAQLNNISENQSVDENGNWQSGWGGGNGLYTYRKAGAIISWDNGRANNAAGLFKYNAEVEVGHDNSVHDRINNVETLLGNAGSHYSYSRNKQSYVMRDLNVIGSLTYNIDSLSRVTANISYAYMDNRSDASNNTSVYSVAANFSNPELGLVGDSLGDGLAAVGINSQTGLNNSRSYYNSFGIDTRFLHRFMKEGYSLEVGARYHKSDYDYSGNSLSIYRYFNTASSPVVQRRYSEAPTGSEMFTLKAMLTGVINKNIQFEATYKYEYENEDEVCKRYSLERYPHYALPELPLGVRPSAADSLAAVIDIENSLYSQLKTQLHSARFNINGKWDKIDAHVGTSVLYHHDRLDYERGGTCYSPERRYVELAPTAMIRWRFVKNGELQFVYNGYERRQQLLDLLPITDTSDEMVERVNNPNIKVGWNNHFDLSSRWFNEKRGDSYYANINGGIYTNSIVNIIRTDPVTGKMLHTKDNVNGNYYISFGGGTEQPLDKERHWTLSAWAGYRLQRNKNYVGALGDELGLSVMYSHAPYGNMNLKWRSGIWSVNLNGRYSAEINRYNNTPQYNQVGHTFECSLQPQADLPFGTKINTSLMFYGRRGFADDIMNHDQWLWNATVSHSFLKNKALTLQLEAVDILGQRTAEYSYITPAMRDFTRKKVFQSYIMLHAVYRFNIGGAK